MSPELIGWAASAILLVTITRQAFEQWRSESNEGVSPSLFVGQCLASAGFLVYAVMRDDTVFVATNALLVLSALFGLAVTWRNRRAST